MGFWSSLGKGLLNVGKGVAQNLPMIAGVAGAPFTAGGSIFAALAPTIGQTIGSTLSGAAGGMAEGRQDINLLNPNYDTMLNGHWRALSLGNSMHPSNSVDVGIC